MMIAYAVFRLAVPALIALSALLLANNNRDIAPQVFDRSHPGHGESLCLFLLPACAGMASLAVAIYAAATTGDVFFAR